MCAPPSRPPCSAPRARTPSNMSTSSRPPALLLFGAKAVIDGDMTVGELVAFNMIAAQVAQPVLRLSQLWQDFQQVQVSVERLGDILNRRPEPTPPSARNCRRRAARSSSASVTFRYRPGRPQVLKQISLRVNPGKVVGHRRSLGLGQVDADQTGPALLHPRGRPGPARRHGSPQVDPAWLRSHIGVVLQENLLFNRRSTKTSPWPIRPCLARR